MAPVSPRTQCLAAKEESGKYQEHYIRSFLMEENQLPCVRTASNPPHTMFGIYNHLPRATYLNRLQSNQNMLRKYLCPAAVTAAGMRATTAMGQQENAGIALTIAV